MPRAASRPLPRRSCRTLDPMPVYSWSCSSCGRPNSAGSQVCPSCFCPAEATAAQIERHRAAFVATGGTLGLSASSSIQPELGTAQFFATVALLALGGWPFLPIAGSGRYLWLVGVGAVLALVGCSLVRSASLAGWAPFVLLLGLGILAVGGYGCIHSSSRVPPPSKDEV